MNKTIIVITGKRGAGKTGYCEELLRQAKENSLLKVRGFISPAVYQDGRKTAFFLLDAATQECRLCGRRTDGESTIGCWQMDEAVLAKGNDILSQASPCDLLFIDELGPLEFDKGKGFTKAFEVLRNGEYDKAYVVIRPECLEQFRQLFPDFQTYWIGRD